MSKVTCKCCKFEVTKFTTETVNDLVYGDSICEECLEGCFELIPGCGHYKHLDDLTCYRCYPPERT